MIEDGQEKNSDRRKKKSSRIKQSLFEGKYEIPMLRSQQSDNRMVDESGENKGNNDSKEQVQFRMTV